MAPKPKLPLFLVRETKTKDINLVKKALGNERVKDYLR